MILSIQKYHCLRIQFFKVYVILKVRRDDRDEGKQPVPKRKYCVLKKNEALGQNTGSTAIT